MSVREWLARLLAVGRRGRRDHELDEELNFHLGRLAAGYERRGLAPEAARQAAERDFGGLERTRQAWRDQRTWLPLEELLQDARYGWRTLRRTPGVTLAAACTLALAVAATASVFSLVDAVLLAPLPYPDAGRLVAISEYYRPMHASGVSVASGNFLDWRDRAHAFAAMTAIERREQNLTGGGEPEHLSIAAVTEDFARTVGVQPALGRSFAREEFAAGRDGVALLSHRLWVSRYAASPSVVGRAITLDDRSYTVVGVMPAGFLFPEPGYDVWVPLVMTAADRANHSGHTLLAVGRLRAGVGLAAGTRDLQAVAESLRRERPDTDGDWDVTVQSARDALVGDTGDVLLAVMAAVVLLLLVACASISGLLLARGLARARELAVRTAIGASRWRLARQLVTESVLLALAGGAAGVLAAWAAQPLLATLRPADLLAWKPVAIDARALIVALGASVAAGVITGTAPVFVAARADIGAIASSRSAGPGGARTRQALVAFEMALAFILVAAAALLARTLDRLTSADLGLVPGHVVTMEVSLPDSRYPGDERVRAFYDALFDRIRALPGVVHVGATAELPLSGNTSVRPYQVPGGPTGRDRPVAHYRLVTPGYVEAMGIRLVAGRAFDERDTAGRPLVVLVNERLAAQAFGSRNPVGQRITFGGAPDLWATVVGVVGDVRHFGAGQPASAEMYWPAAQIDAAPGETLRLMRRNMSLVVAAAGDPVLVVPSIRAALHALDPEEPLAAVRTMKSLVDESLTLPRASAWVVSVFGAAALLFALLAVFGAASYAVVQRRRELAVRLALGASPRAVSRLVARGAVSGAAVGLAAGLALTLAFARTMASLFVGVAPPPPGLLALVSAAIAASVTLACWLPARRAARIDPVETLRSE
ncbi:MAG: ADOP family duplicated permease [Betaproteobacteria bacterium]